MPLYKYQGFSRGGKKVGGTLDVPSESVLRELLQKQDVYPTYIIAVHKMGGQSQSFFATIFEKKVSQKDLLIFTKQLSVLLRSGVPLLQSLELLDGQFEGQLRTIIVSLKDVLKEGGSLADGLRNYPRVFENIYIQLVRAGEASGKLEMILDRLVVYIQERDDLRGRIGSAMRGPLIQLSAVFGITLFMAAGVIPKLAGMFTSMGGTLPLPTKIVMAISDVVLGYPLVLIFAFLGIVVTFTYWKQTESGAYRWDVLMLNLPLVSFFARMNAIVEFCSTLGMLLTAGVRLSEALDIVCNIVDNRVLKKSLFEARDKIIKQGKIAQYLKQTHIFPPIAMYLISTGEESGKLDEMLLEVAKNYTAELKEKIDGLTAALDPLMMAVMAIVVGFIVMAIALPLMNMSSNLKL